MMTRIKIDIMKLLILLVSAAISLIYFFLKLFPVKQGKVLFCSRQSNEPSLDFILLKNEIKETNPEAKFVAVCSHSDGSFKGLLSFVFSSLKSMYHLATSQICIIDSYWPAVSMLKHKKSLKVIQIWHSIGKVKSSGYQSLGKKSGRDMHFAHMLKMHENYDYLIGGAPIWNQYYCEAFNIEKEKILNYGLPRIDYLVQNEEKNKKRFQKEFPELVGKKIILYAPTFRKNMKSSWDSIGKAKKYDDIVVIIKNHPGKFAKKIEESSNIKYIDSWETIDLIAACDYMITDYSSIALEAAVLKRKTFFWTYDYDEYMENSGINFDLKREMSDWVFRDINDIMDCIENEVYNEEQQKQYIDKYVPASLVGATEKIASLVVGLMGEQQVVDDEIRDYGRRTREAVAQLYEHTQAYGTNPGGTLDLQDNTNFDGEEAVGFGNNSNVS